MDLYIDKENLRSLIKDRINPKYYDRNIKGYEDCYEDCMRLLRRQLHVKYNFEKSLDLLNDEAFYAYFLQSNQGNGWGNQKSEFLAEAFPNRPLDDTISDSFDEKQRSSVYLIDDEKMDVFKDKGNILVGRVGEEIDVLKQLFCSSKNYDFDKKYDIHRSGLVNGWKQLSKDHLTNPLSDIIMADRYIGSNLKFIANNLYPLLEVLVEKAHSEVNIVLLTDKTEGITKQQWDEVMTNIRCVVSRKTEKQCYVTIVFYPPSKKSRPHDRIILTNYMEYGSGGSFSGYYNLAGRMMTNGSRFYAHSLAKRDNYRDAKDMMKYYQKVCDDTLESDSEYVIGDKKSNYLDFSKKQVKTLPLSNEDGTQVNNSTNETNIENAAGEEREVQNTCAKTQECVSSDYMDNRESNLLTSEVNEEKAETPSATENEVVPRKYEVVTLCGSTRFKDEFLRVQKELTRQGKKVFSVELFGSSEDGDDDVLGEDTKEMIEELNKRKIDMADYVYIINVDGYIGQSTRSEIEYAEKLGKKVKYLSEV